MSGSYDSAVFNNLLIELKHLMLMCFVNADELFLILYKELYYRHVYARVPVICIELVFMISNKHAQFLLLNCCRPSLAEIYR